MESFLLKGLVEIFLVLVVVSAALLMMRRNMVGLFNAYAMQSFFLAAIALFLFLEKQHPLLLYAAFVTILSKALFIPWLLKRVQRKIGISRDIDFRYLKPTGSLMAAILIIIGMYALFFKLLEPFAEDKVASLGVVLGFSLVLIGMLAIFTRRQTITKILGYLCMENGMVLLSLFLGEMPLLIEVLVLMDLIMVVLISAIFAFGINSTIEQFHARLNPLHEWLRGEKK